MSTSNFLKEGDVSLGAVFKDDDARLIAAAPMTSVIEWRRYDGTPETLPTHNVLMVDNGHCHSGFVGKNGNRPCWIASVAYNGLVRMIREVSIGDLWAYLPTPPEEVQ